MSIINLSDFYYNSLNSPYLLSVISCMFISPNVDFGWEDPEHAPRKYAEGLYKSDDDWTRTQSLAVTTNPSCLTWPEQTHTCMFENAKAATEEATE